MSTSACVSQNIYWFLKRNIKKKNQHRNKLGSSYTYAVGNTKELEISQPFYTAYAGERVLSLCENWLLSLLSRKGTSRDRELEETTIIRKQLKIEKLYPFNCWPEHLQWETLVLLWICTHLHYLCPAHAVPNPARAAMCYTCTAQPLQRCWLRGIHTTHL